VCRIDGLISFTKISYPRLRIGFGDVRGKGPKATRLKHLGSRQIMKRHPFRHIPTLAEGNAGQNRAL
jgi:hypothetical protein